MELDYLYTLANDRLQLIIMGKNLTFGFSYSVNF